MIGVEIQHILPIRFSKYNFERTNEVSQCSNSNIEPFNQLIKNSFTVLQIKYYYSISMPPLTIVEQRIA